MVRPSLLMDTITILYHQSVYDIPIYAHASSFDEKQSNQVTPEQLSKIWRIGIKTDQLNLKDTTHQCIRTTVLLVKRFKKDKAQLW